MNQWGMEEKGDRWSSILHSLNGIAPVDLRVNSLNSKISQVKDRLESEGVLTEIIPGLENALTMKERKNIFITKAFQEGLVEVQDRGSQKIAPFLQIESGMTVIDACAGGGGKSLHMASLMQNKGKIISLDIHEWKLKALQERARRNKVNIIETKVIDSRSLLQSLEGKADRVLLDVPCTGMGVLRRNPMTKWKLSKSEVDQLRFTQAKLLSEYSLMLRPGGLMVYATCSMMDSENIQQIETFLKNTDKKWKLMDQINIDPDQNEGDGFFAALLQSNVSRQ
jgi:16S rRNA (cytosine967-C5)-methyltransferase